jgi:hypothetical protein
MKERKKEGKKKKVLNVCEREKNKKLKERCNDNFIRNKFKNCTNRHSITKW